MEKKTIIGFVGRIASGKGAASSYVSQKYNLPEIEYSGFLDETFAIFSISATRTSYQQLSGFLRSTYGTDVFERAVMRKIRNIPDDAFVLCGIRRESDFSSIRKEFALHLIYIDTPQQMRYEWLRGRVRSEGDKEMSFEGFGIRDSSEPEQQIEGLKAIADTVIENNGSKEDLYAKIDLILDPLLKN